MKDMSQKLEETEESKIFHQVTTGTEEMIRRVEENPQVMKVENYWKMLGPGLTTGAADDDPSGIGTYSQAGSQFGYNLLWLSIFTFPLMSVVQEMCARVGLETGRGLAANIRLHFSRKALYFTAILLFAANSFNIGADLGAMAKATQLVFPSLPFAVVLIFFTALSASLQIFSTYEKYARYLKYLVLILFAYVLSALFANIPWTSVVTKALVPSVTFSREQIILICAILGTTISPYLFFWQTSQEVEEQILAGKTTIKEREGASDKEIRDMRIDVWSGMGVSNIIMFFIIATAAATLNAHGVTNISTAAEAAEALRPIAGNASYFLFTLGIIGTGMLAVPVLAGSASYAVAESFRWKTGLYRKLHDAVAFYGIIIISMFLGLIMNFMGLDQMKALIYSAVFNGFVSPVVLVFIVLLSSNKRVMKKHVNSRPITFIGWGITLLMLISGIAAFVSLLF